MLWYASLRVLFMSGYTGDVLTGLRGPDRHVALVAKRFTPETLLSCVRKALGG